VQINLSDMDLPRWEHELRADLTIIEALLAEMNKVTPSDDAKLQHLKTTILSKLASPINQGNRKVLVFTAFADTADYLYDHLAPFFLESQKLHTAEITGGNNQRSTLKKSYDFQSLLTLFSPRSKDKALILPKEPGEIDLLIGTDCISEGQNLQDCDYLINYDIHWNPVRIIQRFGRIDRIGSQNRAIQLVNYWPDISLDEYINLKERVENRMVIADVTATGDDNPLDAKANDVAYRREQLRRLQDEVIELEDLKTGISITDLELAVPHCAGPRFAPLRAAGRTFWVGWSGGDWQAGGHEHGLRITKTLRVTFGHRQPVGGQGRGLETGRKESGDRAGLAMGS
jgi:superfamily II DNA/RNA helicase